MYVFILSCLLHCDRGVAKGEVGGEGLGTRLRPCVKCLIHSVISLST